MFPFSDEIQLGTVTESVTITVQDAHRIVGELLTMERKQKIDRVVNGRTFNVVPVLENIYDRGNVSAVMRSAEAFGLGGIHLIESERFKESQRTTAGADKWLEVQRWKSTSECVAELKRQKKQIVVTHLGATAKPIEEVDFTVPTALVLGNEKDGASQEILDACDHRVILPMLGFVQSFNISVAAALCFYHVYADRMRRKSFHGDLTEAQKMILQAHYYMRTQPSSEEQLIELFKRGQVARK